MPGRTDVLTFQAQAYWCPKDGQAPAEWEDAAAYSIRRQRFAVADGATNAYRARDWASALTSGYLDDFPGEFADAPQDKRAETVREWLVAQAERWHRDSPSPTAWYEEDAARGGSAAAFLGLQFAEVDGELRWEAVAIGDCCLFQVREGSPVVCFPVSASTGFGSYPDLMPTAPERLAAATDQVALEYGTARDADLFLLASDAFSEWLLAQAEAEPATWGELAYFDDDRFSEFVRDRQREGLMKADDVTAMVIRVARRRSPRAVPSAAAASPPRPRPAPGPK